MTISVAEAKFISLVIEAPLFVFMFGVTIWVLRNSNISPRTIHAMIAVASSLCILSILHLIANATYANQGFVGPGSDDPETYFNLDVQRENFKNVVYLFQTLIGDGVLIWRCWILWERKLWIIILLVLGWMAVVACSIGTIYVIGQPTTTSTNVYQTTVRWSPAFYGSTLATNLLATGLLAFRIWTVSRQSSEHRTSRPDYASRVLVTIVECGALYSASLLTMLVSFLIGSNSAFLIIDLVGCVIPITFYLLILRLVLTRRQSQSSDRQHLHYRTSRMSAQTKSWLKTSEPQCRNNGDLEAEAIRIHIHKVIEKDMEGTEVEAETRTR